MAEIKENESLICPVSLEKFTYPVILTCGHTFDKPSLDKLSSNLCPVCKQAFSIDKNTINWVVVNLLNLDIKIESTPSKDDSKHMRKLAESRWWIIAEEKSQQVLKEIKKNANAGLFICQLNYSDHKDILIYDKHIQKYLEKLNYCVKLGHSSKISHLMTITW